MESLQKDALACLRVGLSAVDPEALVEADLSHRELPPSDTIHLVAVGKAAVPMARGAMRALALRASAGGPSAPVSGVLVAPSGQTSDAPPELRAFGGGHPVPNAEGVLGAGVIHELASGLGERDLLLCLISGGGSALMTLPPTGVSHEDIQAVSGELMRAGATIGELNCVRKHLDQLKGGRLAAAAWPARTLALVLSDVVGDPLDVIASGPVSADPTTFSEAIAVARRLKVWALFPDSVREHLEQGKAGRVRESPKPGERSLERAEAEVIGNNRLAAEAALGEARRRGYTPMLLSTRLTGEAREIGRALAAVGLEAALSGHPAEPPICLLAAGETTVSVRGSGRGGRNQEVALGAALAFDEAGEVEGREILIASLGTDGIDGPTDAAGAFADTTTVSRGKRLGLDPRKALAENDAYPFFDALGDLILTGPTGTNVMDLQLVLTRPLKGG